MYQNVLNNYAFTKDDIKKQYIVKLNAMADSLLNNQRFGTKVNVDRTLFLQIKNLMYIVNDNSGTTCVLNKLYNVLNNK